MDSTMEYLWQDLSIIKRKVSFTKRIKMKHGTKYLVGS